MKRREEIAIFATVALIVSRAVCDPSSPASSLCSDSYLKSAKPFEGCPPKRCGVLGISSFVRSDSLEWDTLDLFARRTVGSAEPNGSATFFDITSRAITNKEVFILFPGHLLATEVKLLEAISRRARAAIKKHFGVPAQLYLKSPMFISQLTATGPDLVPYWQEHVDQFTYDHSDYHWSAILYLDTYDQDFQGGRLIFTSGPGTASSHALSPKRGLMALFSSGEENPHRVERVSRGQRRALTMFFSCDPDGEFRFDSSATAEEEKKP